MGTLNVVICTYIAINYEGIAHGESLIPIICLRLIAPTSPRKQKRRKIMRINKLRPEYVDTMPSKSEMKEGVLYVSRVYLTTAHLCACGCGNVVVLPYGRRDGMFWTLTERLSGVTMRPSVGSFNLPCKSHYYITDNKVEWL